MKVCIVYNSSVVQCPFDYTAVAVSRKVGDYTAVAVSRKVGALETRLATPVAVAEWLSSWLVEQEVRGSIPRLAT